MKIYCHALAFYGWRASRNNVTPSYPQQHNRKTIMWDLEPESALALAKDAAAMARYVIDNAKPA